MYFLHVGSGNYKKGYDYYRPDIMMGNLLAERKIDPMVVVMPDYGRSIVTSSLIHSSSLMF
jgi:enterochelin esterase-like enzyme